MHIVIVKRELYCIEVIYKEILCLTKSHRWKHEGDRMLPSDNTHALLTNCSK